MSTHLNIEQILLPVPSFDSIHVLFPNLTQWVKMKSQTTLYMYSVSLCLLLFCDNTQNLNPKYSITE